MVHITYTVSRPITKINPKLYFNLILDDLNDNNISRAADYHCEKVNSSTAKNPSKIRVARNLCYRLSNR